MSTDIAFSVRPLTGSVGGDQDKDLDGGAFRVHISQALTPLGFANGDLVRLRTSSGFKGYAIAWQAKTLHKSHHVNVHDYLREQYKLSLKDPVFIEKAVDFWKPLKVIAVRPSAHVEDLAKFSSTEELAFWARYALGKLNPSTSVSGTPT
jgi:AAA family ATPase